MYDIDYDSALSGASTIRDLSRVASSLAVTAAQAAGPRDVQQAAGMARALGAALARKAKENVEVASQAGFLPTNYLGVDSERQWAGGIPAGGERQVTINPSVDVRITGFRMDSAFADDFTITRINVATLDLIVGQDGVPSSAFTSGISLPPIAAPKLPGGSAAEVNFLNVSGAARRARALFPVIKLNHPGC